jgi:hypothetical protein
MGIVASISAGNPAMVTCVEDERLEFQVTTYQFLKIYFQFHSKYYSTDTIVLV